jgi:hypothetical protein
MSNPYGVMPARYGLDNVLRRVGDEYRQLRWASRAGHGGVLTGRRGALMGESCIVGGLVSKLLIDQQIGPDPDTGDMHPGTNHLDGGLAVGQVQDRPWRA